MTKIPRNSSCPCGSGRKYKRCCEQVKFDVSPGIEGLKRPEYIPVEASFDEFVKEQGGQLVSEMIGNALQRPKNADYYFPNSDVIVELKSFEKDQFNSAEDVERVGRIIQKHNHVITGSHAIRWLFGREPTPKEYIRDMLSLARRHIENTVRKANKQIEQTKKYLDVPNAKGLVLIANDGNYFMHPPGAFSLVCQVMTEHFMESAVDGIVYFTVNVVARDPRSERELTVWMPGYRMEGDGLAKFVNQLGSNWHEFYSRMIGQDVAHFKTDDIRATKLLRLFKPSK